jgi:ABC-type multidrug transport system fused ATPase/permease subunit
MHALAIIWRVLTPAQRRWFVALQFVSLLMAASTVVGLAAVMTFLAVLADPTLIDTHAALHWMWQALDTPRREFVIALGGGFIALLVVSAVVNVLGSRVMGRFAYAVGDRIREVLFAGYLRRDYLFHAQVGAGRLSDHVLNQASRVTITLLHGQQLVTNAVLTLLVVASIAVVSPWVAVGGALGIAGGYFLFYRVIRRRIGRHGRLQADLSIERVALVEQAFHGIKYLLVAGAQDSFDKRFAAVTRTLSHSFADAQFIGQLPKYVLECVAGAGLIACAAFVSGGSAGSAWIAQLSFIGFAGFRLLPAFQQMYLAFVIVRGNRAAIEDVAAELAHGVVPVVEPLPRVAREPALVRGVDLIGVSFQYSPAAPRVLDDASLHIPAGAVTGIVGASGCGKTTLVDLVLGLLEPVGGRIEIDGKTLDARRVPAWQRCIGYVPQDVLILHGPVRENIAFGVDPSEIDDARVREVARLAGAAAFIEALPGGYAARISGVGGGLSGGQRQRIGIARALYREPSLLVLDEATNSLDADTERAIIDTVIRNRGAQTVLIVAHGGAVIDACDQVFELRDGALRERPPRAQDSPQTRGHVERVRRSPI